MSSPTLSEQLHDTQHALTVLIAAKDEKDANGESERYRELKRDAWGNARSALALMPSLIERVEALEAAAPPVGKSCRSENPYSERQPALTSPDEGQAVLPVGEGLRAVADSLFNAIMRAIAAASPATDDSVTDLIAEAQYALAALRSVSSVEAPLLAKLAEREAEVQRLRKALAYVADRAWVAVSPRAGDWVREFADVAGKALARESAHAAGSTVGGVGV